MHPFFDPLDTREAVLLLTTLMAGSEETSVFRHLSRESHARMAQKAEQLLQLPADKRVPFMTHELRQAWNAGLRGVEKVDPSWILHGLRGESPRVVACVLLELPPTTARSVLKRLPPGIRKKLPPKAEVKALPPELKRTIRQIFESRFHAMPMPSVKGFAYRDIAQLEKSDLFRVMRDLGLIELGQAFVAVGKMALAELCRRLPRDKAEELILAVRSASRIDVPDLKNAQRFLSRVVVNFTDTEEFFQKAGLWRMAKASLIEDDAFREGFRQRLPREAGQLFFTYMEKAGEIEELSPEMLQRLQDSVLVRVRELSKRGIIEGRWSDLPMLFHTPQTDEAA